MKRLFEILKTSLIITVFVAFLNVFFFTGGPITGTVVIRGIVIGFIFSFGLTAVNSYFYDVIELRYNWEKEPKKRLWIGAIGSFLLTILTFGILRYLIHFYYTGVGIAQFLEEEDASAYVIALGITVIAILFTHAFYFYRALQKREVKEQTIIARSASASFDALKNQLDPHFLFNSLNVLTSLIEEDPSQAQKFTTSLSKVYRYVLEQKNKDLVSVDEELDFARTYVRLLKMRFEDSILFDIPENALNPEGKIVPLSLQLLLENAVKHNVVSSSKPLHIKVEEKNGLLTVTNNLQPKEVVKKSSGVGLRNIQQRYEILGNDAMKILKTGTHFSVQIPVLNKEIQVVETQEEFIEEKKYLKAKERVGKIKGFYGNLISYAVVIPVLWFINYKTTSFAWAFFPTLGWGLGLLFHGMEAFAYNPFLGRNWEEKKIQELMEDDSF